MLRSVAAIAAGYLIFGIATVVLFAATGQDPHELPPVRTIVFFTTYGAVFAFLGGYVTALIASQREVLHAAALAGLIAAIAIVSLVMESPRGFVWTELAVLAAMVPAALAGGVVRARAVPFRAPSA
jgi:hypothetical protein